MKFATIQAGEAAFKALQIAKSLKVRIAVLLIALIAPGIALADGTEVTGG